MDLKAQLAQVHWGLVFKTAVLLYVVTFILGVVLSIPLLAFLPGDHLDSQRAVQATFLISAGLVIVVTGFGAFWVARRVERAAVLNGFLVGLVVAIISVALDLLFSRQASLVGVVLYLLMVAAGVLGGVVGSRRQRQPS